MYIVFLKQKTKDWYQQRESTKSDNNTQWDVGVEIA